MADLACTAHITMWTSPDGLDGLAFGRTMDRLYGLILDQSRPPGPIVGPLGTLLKKLCTALLRRFITSFGSAQ